VHIRKALGRRNLAIRVPVRTDHGAALGLRLEICKLYANGRLPHGGHADRSLPGRFRVTRERSGGHIYSAESTSLNPPSDSIKTEIGAVVRSC
jgi:hypothetical protein